MAIDHFVYWKKGKRKPSIAELKLLIEDYLGSVAVKIVESETDFIVTLAGQSSDPWKRLKGWETMAEAAKERGKRKRWFEVDFQQGRGIDVITRQPDEFTENVASGFAKLVARLFEGKVEENDAG